MLVKFSLNLKAISVSLPQASEHFPGSRKWYFHQHLPNFVFRFFKVMGHCILGDLLRKEFPQKGIWRCKIWWVWVQKSCRKEQSFSSSTRCTVFLNYWDPIRTFLARQNRLRSQSMGQSFYTRKQYTTRLFFGNNFNKYLRFLKT